MILKELLTGLEVLQLIGDTNIEVTGIQSDSRRVTSGNVFVAQVGTTVDGHVFIPQCIEKGAAAIVMDQAEHMPTQSNGITYILVKSSDEALGKMAHLWYGEPSKHLQLVGVTGTNGKTTTATLLYRLFKTLGEKVGLLSTVINYVDDEAIASTHTTRRVVAQCIASTNGGGRLYLRFYGGQQSRHRSTTHRRIGICGSIIHQSHTRSYGLSQNL